MQYVIFFIAWIGFLILVVSTRGEPEGNPLALALGWLCLAVIVGCALYTMATGSIWGGVSMIGSLYFFVMKKEKKSPKPKK